MVLSGLDQLEQAGQKLRPKPASASEPVYLRPPGARPEVEFAATCQGCARCVEACPAQCIKLDESVAGGRPQIVARRSPCVVCDELACMKACPTTALRLVESAAEIDMGVAEVDFGLCLRSGRQEGDENCRICVNQCPIGETALDLGDDGRVEVRPGCIGCGVCEWSCPTGPASIVVRPRAT